MLYLFQLLQLGLPGCVIESDSKAPTPSHSQWLEALDYYNAVDYDPSSSKQPFEIDIQ